MTSDLFTIGASSLRVYQTALSTTSDNIANAATPGYNRRSAVIEEFGVGNVHQLGQRANVTGAGSLVTGIARSADLLRQNEVRATGSDLARTESGIVWLERIETALAGNQLGTRLTAFFNSAKSVAADPAASAPRAVMLESASSLATAFAGTARSLDAAIADVESTGADAARDLSSLASQVAANNRALVRAQPGSSAHAQLLDERDKLIDSMSALIDVDVKIDSFGRATVRAGGPTGPVLADQENGGLVTFAMNSSGAVSVAVHLAGTVETLPLRGGAFAGIADGANKLAGMRENLNDLATRFVDTMNSVQSAGQDLDGQPGTALFARGATPTDITVVLNDPRGLAAAAVGEGTRGNGNFSNLEALRTTGNFEAGLDDLAVGNAAALSAKRNVAQAQNAIHGTALSANAEVSGVDLDEEAINLIRFQQAYQASSRVVQVARDILQSILDIR